MDIDSIPPGEDFERHIRREIAACDLVLVLIGDNWLDVMEGSDQRRIDDPDDFVRLEIEAALGREDVRLIPVLVEGASMPRPAELPEGIRRLTRFHAFELSDQRHTADMERLVGFVERIDAARANDARAVSNAAPAVAEPPPTVSDMSTVSDAPSATDKLEAEASNLEFPRGITKAWLLETVPELTGVQLAALMNELSRRRWSRAQIDDQVLCNVDYLQPLRVALGLHDWSPSEIDGFIARWLNGVPESPDAEEAARRQRIATEPYEPRDLPTLDQELPAQITKSWLFETVPDLTGTQLAALMDELYRRGWSDAEVEDQVLSWTCYLEPLREALGLFDWTPSAIDEFIATWGDHVPPENLEAEEAARHQGVGKARKPIDFEAARAFIEGIPAGRWASYGDVAQAAGSPRGAQSIGNWLLTLEWPRFGGHVLSCLRGLWLVGRTER